MDISFLRHAIPNHQNLMLNIIGMTILIISIDPFQYLHQLINVVIRVLFYFV